MKVENAKNSSPIADVLFSDMLLNTHTDISVCLYKYNRNDYF